MEELHDLLSCLLIKCSGRLIRQQDRRIHGDCPGDGDPLLLSAGQLIRIIINPILQPDLFDDFFHPFPPLLLRNVRINQRKFYIFPGCLLLQQLEGLEDKPDLPVADTGELPLVLICDVNA